MKTRKILEVMKVIGFIVNVIEHIEYLEHFWRSHRKPKTVKGFNQECKP